MATKMGRYVDLSQAVTFSYYDEEREEWRSKKGTIEDLLDDLCDSYTITDAVPVVHGYWKAVTDDGIDYKRICSCCGEEAPFDESEDIYLLYPHCPWCGASLDIKGGNGNG